MIGTFFLVSKAALASIDTICNRKTLVEINEIRESCQDGNVVCHTSTRLQVRSAGNATTSTFKKVCDLISSLNLETNSKILFVLSSSNKFFWLSTKNLKNIEVTTAGCLNIEQLLNANHIILSNNGLDLINSTYGKNYE